MKTIHLVRLAYNEKGTWGVFLYDNQPFCVSYELPWILNERNISCIPPGEYLCFERDSAQRRHVYELKDVPGRSNIQIHIGNTDQDTQGCILPAEKFEPIAGKPAVQQSTAAFYEFRNIIAGDPEFILSIEEI